MPASAQGCLIASGLLCLALVGAEWRGHRRARAACKSAASAAFVAGGVLGGLPSGGAFGGWIMAGLVFGAIGDVALLGAGKRAFLAGLGAFLLGHVAYVIAIAAVIPVSTWPTLGGVWTALPALAGAAALAWLWPHLGKMRIPVVAYVIVIVAMVVAAIAAARADGWAAPARAPLLVGALLFFVSDLAVARDKFVRPGVANKLWGLPTYYAGQILIASAAIVAVRG
jgi:uncharacterized membrane protein YhhN